MAATILNSATAVGMSVFVVRAFIRLRDAARTYAALAKQIDDLEHRVTAHDTELRTAFSALRQLLEPRVKPRRTIGFGAKGTR